MRFRGAFWMFALVSLGLVLLSGEVTQAQTPSADLLEERPCGPDSLTGPIRYLFPQGYGNIDFRPSCRCHDRCYEDPNRTQKECDDKFLQQMQSACEKSGGGIGCRLRARLMYTAVRWFGAGAYADGQRKGAARAANQNCAPCQGMVFYQP